ncbi:hypothetical protein ACFVH7_06815 [Kitasatospora indigofera]|uniref:hypothetical protein n=1 Tax=Kitasatospora indigofera TaxID=67307 RepID=UPI00362FBA90
MAARRRMTAGVAAVLLAGLLAGCGGGPAQPPDPSASGTPSSASPSPSDADKPTDRSPHGVLLSAQLAMQTARRAKITYRLGADSAAGLLFWQPKTALQIKRGTPGTAEQLIVMDTTAYQGGDDATAARLGGRHWEKFGGATGADGHKEVPYAGLVDQLNPVVALTAAAAAADPVLLGEEKIDDNTLQHYQVSTTAERYAAAQTQLSESRRAGLRTALAPGGATVLTLDLWLNDKDQLVQLRRTGTGPEGGADDLVQYSDFGGALSVQAPAEADTSDTGTRSTSPLAR